MNTEGYKRKLTAILSADVVGYSRLMAEDEVGTVQRLKSCKELIGVRVREHHGRVVDSPGDNLLAEYPSALDAVRSAVEIQRVLTARNNDLPDDRKMQFRIGIHLGDVMVDDDRIYGDGVNIAARLEGLAATGGVCISGVVHELVRNKLNLVFEDIGNQNVKNIPEPVRVYRISIESNRSAEPKREKPIHFNPGKPSIAVLPFVNMSNDPDQEYFSDGMAEEILNGLAKNSGLIVKARTSSFSDKVRNQDVKTIAELLDVTHILEGSVRKSGSRIRVTAQLINTETDAHIWSERYERELTDVFDIQDDISAAILKELNIHLAGLPDTHKPKTNIEAYNAYLFARYHFNQHKLDEAVTELEKAASLDPNNADVYGLLARVHNAYVLFGISPAKKKWAIIRSYTDKALSLNPNQSDALITNLTISTNTNRAYQDAINEYTRLVEQYPNDTDMLLSYGNFFITIGRIDLVFTVCDHTEKLNPLEPGVYYVRGIAFSQAGRYDQARKSLEKAEMLGDKLPYSLATVAIAEGDLPALQKVLDRGRPNWGATSHIYPLYEAAAYYLKGDHKKVKEILSSAETTRDFTLFFWESLKAVLKGNLDLALEYYEKALSESEYLATFFIQSPTILSIVFPDYRTHPKYLKMLKDVRLDDESIAKLKIPPLPF